MLTFGMWAILGIPSQSRGQDSMLSLLAPVSVPGQGTKTLQGVWSGLSVIGQV